MTPSEAELAVVLDTCMVIGLDTRSSALHAVSTRPIPGGPGGETFYAIDRETKSRDKDLERTNLWMAARLLFQQAEDVGKESHRAVHVFCEEPLALKNGKTTRLLGLAAGAIWAAHMEFNIWWHWVDVVSWKKEVVGRGNASKDDIREFCLGNPAFKKDTRDGPWAGGCDSEPDLYDAWCLKVYGVRWLVKSKTSGGDDG